MKYIFIISNNIKFLNLKLKNLKKKIQIKKKGNMSDHFNSTPDGGLHSRTMPMQRPSS
jgi:hypothetical protein